jgi:mRNA interferase RelE/StbE
MKALERLPAKDQGRIRAALDQLLTAPDRLDVKQLQGRPEWRLRVGRWRVLLRVDHEARIFWAVAAGPRGDIYK